MFYVYILKNQFKGSFYKGWTRNLRNRLEKHGQGGTRTTAKDEYRLIWYCVFPTKITAIRFEKYLKSGSGIAFMRKRLVSYDP